MNRFDHHDHTGSSAKGIVVGGAMLVWRVLPKIVNRYGNDTFLLGALENGIVKGTFQQSRKTGNDVDSHASKLQNVIRVEVAQGRCAR